MLTQSVRIASANEWIILPINVEKLCNIFLLHLFSLRHVIATYNIVIVIACLFFSSGPYTHTHSLVESSYCFSADGLCRRRHNDGLLFVVLLQCKYHQTPAIAHICVTTCKFLASDPILGTNTIERHCIYLLLLSADKTISSLCTEVSLSEWCDLRKMIIDLELCNDSFLRHQSPHIHIASPSYCPCILSAWWWRWM